MSYIITKNLSKHYGNRLALKNVSVSIPKSKIYGLLGPNGAGKTTLIGILSGLVNNNTGSVKIGSLDQAKDAQKVKGVIGLMPQDAALYDNMTPMQHMIYFGRLQGLSKMDAFDQGKDLLEKVGLSGEANVSVRKLSHGMRRSLGFAQALIGNPKVLILDEPTSGLDPLAAKTIRDLIKDLRDEKVTIILCSHNLNEVEELCDWVGILYKGKLLKEDKLSAFGKVTSVVITAKMDQKFAASLKKKSYIASAVLKRKELSVKFKKKDHTNDLLKLCISHGIVVDKIKKGDSLEEAYRRLVKK